MEALAMEVLPRVLPVGWRTIERRVDGAKYVHADGLAVIVSAATELDGRRWLHVSCSRATKLPTWNDLKRVKLAFVGRDRTALQILPPEAKYVNINPYVLHLWSCLDGNVTPDFTAGTGSL